MAGSRFSIQLGRGLRRQCPYCGQSDIFRWWALLEHCPRCGHRFERESGYWVGAVIFNTVLAFVGFFLTFGVFLLASWPRIPWGWLTVVAMVVTGIVPVIFYPWARSLWMAYDLYVHPLEEAEIEKARLRLKD
jgi:uncharacterized protein (DUF983 family)